MLHRMAPVHKLSNVRIMEQLADCVLCGSDVPIIVGNRGNRCRIGANQANSRRAERRRDGEPMRYPAAAAAANRRWNPEAPPPETTPLYVYLIRLEPLRPGRMKIGLSNRVERRLLQFRAYCPDAAILRTWEVPTANHEAVAHVIASAIATRVHGEVFDIPEDQLDDLCSIFDKVLKMP